MFAVAIILLNFANGFSVSVYIPLQKMEDCQIIQDQMRKTYGGRLIRFDCFGNVK